MRDCVDNAYDFWLYIPESFLQHQSTTPVVIFLHGRSLCGHDLNTVLRYGSLDALRRGRRIDAVIIAPQNPGEAWNPHKIVRILDWVEENYRTNHNRVYVLGMSLGGYGTIDFAGTYPERVAAAMALCGGGTLKDYSGLCKVPLWIMHGTADRAVPYSASKSVVEKMLAAGDTSLLRYDWISGYDHGRLARCFYMKKVYDWLFSHELTDDPRCLNTDVTLTDEEFTNVYRSGVDKAFAATIRISE